MTSESKPSGCYVYITLPGQTTAVTAGRFEQTIDRQGAVVGRFVFGRRYLARPDAVAVDPAELRLAARTYETTRMQGVFGALRDAGPDHWGRRIIEKHAGKNSLGELDYLLNSADDRAGALGFGHGQDPPAPRHSFNQTLQLEQLQAIADALIHDDDEPPTGAAAVQISELLLVGTSMGGARPKAVVENADGLWIAKFNHPHDRWNNARVEHAMLTLGRACGLAVAQSQVMAVANRDVLLVKRFDREKVASGYHRARMVSGLTLLRADDDHRSPEVWSYLSLVEELRRVCAGPKNNAAELFRRMVFNALISNLDDHPRNHAVIARDQDWHLSPAYDLTPSSPVSLERRDLALSCGDWGRYANRTNLLSQAARFLLAPGEGEHIVTEIEECVAKTWYTVARRAGVSERDCEAIKGAFVYPGFHLPPQP